MLFVWLSPQRNLLEYYNAVDADTMMTVFASMLFERRIIFSSKHLNRLSACVQAANSLLYPMTWQHIYIPVIPECLLDYLHAPMPFLIGVPDVLMSVSWSLCPPAFSYRVPDALMSVSWSPCPHAFFLSGSPMPSCLWVDLHAPLPFLIPMSVSFQTSF